MDWHSKIFSPRHSKIDLFTSYCKSYVINQAQWLNYFTFSDIHFWSWNEGKTITSYTNLKNTSRGASIFEKLMTWVFSLLWERIPFIQVFHESIKATIFFFSPSSSISERLNLLESFHKGWDQYSYSFIFRMPTIILIFNHL